MRTQWALAIAVGVSVSGCGAGRRSGLKKVSPEIIAMQKIPVATPAVVEEELDPDSTITFDIEKSGPAVSPGELWYGITFSPPARFSDWAVAVAAALPRNRLNLKKNSVCVWKDQIVQRGENGEFAAREWSVVDRRGADNCLRISHHLLVEQRGAWMMPSEAAADPEWSWLRFVRKLDVGPIERTDSARRQSNEQYFAAHPKEGHLRMSVDVCKGGARDPDGWAAANTQVNFHPL